MFHLTRRRFGLAGSIMLLEAARARVRAASPAAPPEILIGLVTAKSTGKLPREIPGLPDMSLRAQQLDIGGSLRTGVQYAVSEFNAKGGVLGRKLRLVIEELDPSQKKIRYHSIEAARRLVAQKGMLAVIGHISPEDALPASITYSEHGVVFLAPTITLGDLNGHGLPNVFATIPDNKTISKQTATFIYGRGLKNVAVLRSRTAEADEQSLGFLDQAALLGMTETVQASYSPGRRDFRDILANLRAKPSDTLFIASTPEDAMIIIRQGHELQLPVTYVLGGLRDPTVLLPAIKDIPVTVIVPVLEDPSVDSPDQIEFEAAYRKANGRPSDDWAWQGYDAVGLLAAVIEQTKSFEVEAVIATLRYTAAWAGLMGKYSFERTGRIYTRHVAYAVMENGALTYFDLAD
jgi:branched-chain amino acid transport system substrate-binding protein